MREVCTRSLPDDFKFQEVAEAREAMASLSRTLEDREAEVMREAAAATNSKQQPIKTEQQQQQQSSLLKAGLLDGGTSHPALKDSFEARSIKGEGEAAASGRIYSLSDTSGRLYLKRIQSLAEAKKTQRIVKYPLAPHFWSRSRAARNILITSQHDLRRLARSGGQTTSEGFKYDSKANLAVWPYPCPRPTFRTSWLYRTACMASLHCVAMQLRILWMCLKWDDMNTKPPNPDGKNQVPKPDLLLV